MKNQYQYLIEWNVSHFGGMPNREYFKTYEEAMNRQKQLRDEYGWGEWVVINFFPVTRTAQRYAEQMAEVARQKRIQEFQNTTK